ncbi:MAG: hypothetical protein ACYDHG_10610 [Desulfomonilaceae bacterium]
MRYSGGVSAVDLPLGLRTQDGTGGKGLGEMPSDGGNGAREQ